MNVNRYPSDEYFGDYPRLSPTSPFLPFSSSSLLSARNMSTSIDDDIANLPSGKPEDVYRYR